MSTLKLKTAAKCFSLSNVKICFYSIESRKPNFLFVCKPPDLVDIFVLTSARPNIMGRRRSIEPPLSPFSQRTVRCWLKVLQHLGNAIEALFEKSLFVRAALRDFKWLCVSNVSVKCFHSNWKCIMHTGRWNIYYLFIRKFIPKKKIWYLTVNIEGHFHSSDTSIIMSWKY